MSREDEVRSKIEADYREAWASFEFGAVIDRSAALDHARDLVEYITGVPCVAQFNGTEIIVSQAFRSVA